MDRMGRDMEITEPRIVKISEMFGPVLQGEGRSVGKPCVFIRFALCNLDCRWCDTPFTWDWKGKNGIAFDPAEEIHRLSVEEIVEWCSPQYRVIISGGEPFVQRQALLELTDALIANDHGVEVETNGTFSPEGFNEAIRFNVSPKINSSGVAFNRAIKPEILEEFVERSAIFKFVVSDSNDIRDIEELRKQIYIPKSMIYLMPEGRTREEILAKLPALFEICSKNGWSLSPRLHVLAFNDKRGV